MTGPKLIVETNKEVKDIFFGSQIISQVFCGTDLVFSHYPVSGIVFEKSISGSYSFTPDIDGLYEFDIVGAGGGGAWSQYGDTKYVYYTNCSGGGGGYVHGYISLTKGTTYTLVVGAGGSKATGNYDQVASAGANSTGFGQTANGGGGGHANSVAWSAHTPGAGGTYTTTYEGHNGNDGGASYGIVDRTIVYGGQSYFGGEYGRGGQAGNTTAANGVDGYIRIRYIGAVIFSQNTPGQYNFIPDVDGLYEIVVVGAGGGGSAAWDQSKYYYKSRAAGGASGAYVKGVWNLQRGQTYSITVGAGGTKAENNTWGTATSGNGGSSSFGNFITCTGGSGSVTHYNQGSTVGAGGMATATGYTTLVDSTNGNSGTSVTAYHNVAAGGESPFQSHGSGGQAYCNGGGAISSNGESGFVRIAYVGSN